MPAHNYLRLGNQLRLSWKDGKKVKYVYNFDISVIKNKNWWPSSKTKKK